MEKPTQKVLSHAATIFPVNDPLATAKYYERIFGFTIKFRWDDPPTYVVVNRDEAVPIHFVKKEDDFKPSIVHTSLFVFTWDIDQLYKELLKAGAEISSPLADREYGMRDFDVLDNNGFRLTFGQNLDHE